MSYKKLVSLLAVSTLALAACGSDNAEEPKVDETEQTEETETTETEGSSTQELIDQAKNESGDAFPDYGLEVVGTWTVDGYEVGYAPGEAATIPANVITEAADGYNVYLLEDGVVAEVVSDTPEVEFTVDTPSADTEYVVGVSPEDLGQAGDEVAVEDFERFETILLVEQEPTDEEAE